MAKLPEEKVALVTSFGIGRALAPMKPPDCGQPERPVLQDAQPDSYLIDGGSLSQ